MRTSQTVSFNTFSDSYKNQNENDPIEFLIEGTVEYYHEDGYLYVHSVHLDISNDGVLLDKRLFDIDEIRSWEEEATSKVLSFAYEE